MAMAKKRKAAAKTKDPTADLRRGIPSDSEEMDNVEPTTKKVAKATTTTMKSSSSASPSPDVAAVAGVAKQIITAFEHKDDLSCSSSPSSPSNHDRFLDDCDNNGTVERKLWPWFLHLASSANSSSAAAAAAGGGGEEQEENIALALVILSNL